VETVGQANAAELDRQEVTARRALLAVDPRGADFISGAQQLPDGIHTVDGQQIRINNGRPEPI